MDAIELLTQQHRETEALFERFSDTSDESELLEIARTATSQLRWHTTIEEEIFYPAVRQQSEELEADVLEDLEEHHAVELLIDELEGLTPDDERFVPKFTVLSELVTHHVEEEEEEQFAQVRDAFGKSELDELGDRMAARYEELRGEAAADSSTKEELYQQAQKLGIEGRSQMSKRALAKAVREAS